MDNLHKLSEIVENFGAGIFHIASSIALVLGALTARKTAKNKKQKKK